MSAPLALQLFTVRFDAERDFSAVLERVAGIGFRGVETAGRLHTFTPDEFRRRVDDLGLRVVGSYLIGEGDEVPRFLDEQVLIGNAEVVWGLEREDFASRDAIDRAADRFNALADLARDRGLNLSYYNHWWEYTPLPTGEIPMDLFLGRVDPDVLVEFGVYWNQTAGHNPVVTLGRLAHQGRRVRRAHLQDGPATRDGLPTVIGTGRVDVPAVIAALVEADAEWLVMAFDEFDGDMFDAVEQGYQYLTASGLGAGRKA